MATPASNEVQNIFGYIKESGEGSQRLLLGAQNALLQTAQLQLQRQQQAFSQYVAIEELDLAKENQRFSQNIRLQQFEMEKQLHPLQLELERARIGAETRRGISRGLQGQLEGIRDAVIQPSPGVDLNDTLQRARRAKQASTQINSALTAVENGELPALPELQGAMSGDPVADQALALFQEESPMLSTQPQQMAEDDDIDLMNWYVGQAQETISGGTAGERAARLQPLYVQQDKLIQEKAAKGDTKAASIYSQRQIERQQASAIIADANATESDRNAAREVLFRLGTTSDDVNREVVKAASSRRSVDEYQRLKSIEEQRYREYRDALRDASVATGGPGASLQAEGVTAAKAQWERSRAQAEAYGVETRVIPPTVTSEKSPKDRVWEEVEKRLNRL